MSRIEQDDPLADSRISSCEGIMWDFKLENELTRIRSHLSRLSSHIETPDLYWQTIVNISRATDRATWCIVGSITREEQAREAVLVIEEAVHNIDINHSCKKETAAALQKIMLEKAAALKEALGRHHAAVAAMN